MKILFIAPGDSLHTSRWIERVKARGIDCIYYDMTSEDLMHPLSVSGIYRLKGDSIGKHAQALFKKFGPFGKILESILLTLSHYKEIRTIVASEKPDLIHLHWLFHAAALATSFIKGVPIISTPWGSDLLTPEYKVTSKLLDKFKHKYVVSRVIKNSQAFCCDAPHMKELLISFGAESNTIQIIYFGTDVNLFSPTNRNLTFWEKFGLKNDRLKVLSNRVLADMYDIETFIRASAIVHDSIGNVDFLIAGGGPKSDSLKEYAKVNGTKKGITFTGRLNDEDFSSATSSCDIYVSTSPTDGGIAASVAEAMSASVPVVITDFGDNAYWLKDQTAGFIFQIGNEHELAELIIRLAKDEKQRKNMGRKGRDVILEENNSVIEVEKILKLYFSIIPSE
jgi:glycosyltransferase involved in cell wall biosynthesis